MTTVADLIEDTRQHLYGTYRAEFNFLTSSITSSATTLTLDLAMTGVGRGALLSVDDEILFVKSVTGQVATVARGWTGGSAAAAHDSGDIVEVNPRFNRQAIKDALQAEIRSWGAGIYWEDTIALSGTSTSRDYDLTSIGDFYAVSEVYRDGYSTYDPPVPVPFRVQRKVATGDYASGSVLVLNAPLAEATDLQVVVQKPFVVSTFADATDVESTCKLPATALDIPPLGAAWRLLSTREIRRTDTGPQAESRIATEVPPGYTDQTAARLKRVRDERLDEEAARLRTRSPLRF